jgi:hypothetical protein
MGLGIDIIREMAIIFKSSLGLSASGASTPSRPAPPAAIPSASTPSTAGGRPSEKAIGDWARREQPADHFGALPEPPLLGRTCGLIGEVRLDLLKHPQQCDGERRMYEIPLPHAQSYSI